jgi:hypothetical protein
MASPLAPRTDFEKFAAWEREYARSEPVDYERNVRIYEAFYREAVELGVLPSEDPLAGIEHKVRLARLLNIPVRPPEGPDFSLQGC